MKYLRQTSLQGQKFIERTVLEVQIQDWAALASAEGSGWRCQSVCCGRIRGEPGCREAGPHSADITKHLMGTT